MIVRHPIGQFILENKSSGTMYLIQQLYPTLKKKHMFFQDLKEIWWNIYHQQAFRKLHNICCIAQAQENDKKKEGIWHEQEREKSWTCKRKMATAMEDEYGVSAGPDFQ